MLSVAVTKVYSINHSDMSDAFHHANLLYSDQVFFQLQCLDVAFLAGGSVSKLVGSLYGLKEVSKI